MDFLSVFLEIENEKGWVIFVTFGIRMDLVESRFEIKSAHVKKKKYIYMNNHVLTQSFYLPKCFHLKAGLVRE